jgi:hypothetical protein
MACRKISAGAGGTLPGTAGDSRSHVSVAKSLLRRLPGLIPAQFGRIPGNAKRMEYIPSHMGLVFPGVTDGLKAERNKLSEEKV